MAATNNSAKMLNRCPHSVAGVEWQIKNLRLALLGTTIDATVSRSLSRLTSGFASISTFEGE